MLKVKYKNKATKQVAYFEDYIGAGMFLLGFSGDTYMNNDYFGVFTLQDEEIGGMNVFKRYNVETPDRMNQRAFKWYVSVYWAQFDEVDISVTGVSEHGED